jgi:phosphoenolpyruvate phosphomutase
MTRKTTQLRNLLRSPQLEFLMEAHNGLSARIVQEAGFRGIWGSGLSISAAMGVRDSNEASWTQVLETAEFINDAVNLPILLDADTGYGNFNNVRRLVRKLEQRGIAGMCIEDKLFPKTNSFINGEQQSLAEIGEFAGKIKAAKDTQQDPDFCVVARLESLIVGHRLTETLERARAYHQAGADALLIHSKRSTPEQILAFMHQWKETCPVVIVPTSYFKTPAEVFETAKVSVVIWANHLMRASLAAMQAAAAKIYHSRSLVQVEEEIASLREVFRLQDVAELETAEDRYLPKRANSSSHQERSLLQAA